MNEKWIDRFLGLAQEIAQWSRDPSTKVGAVIVDPDRRIVGLGYNGFPRGVEDTPERYADRETKYSMVVHAEINAILNANAPVKGCALFVWPLFPCCECAKLIIQSGIEAVYAPDTGEPRWAESFAVTRTMFVEAGVLFPAWRV